MADASRGDASAARRRRAPASPPPRPRLATEFGAFERSWRDSAGARSTEFGRYVALLVHEADGSWRMDRFFGFADSTRPAPPRP